MRPMRWSMWPATPAPMTSARATSRNAPISGIRARCSIRFARSARPWSPPTKSTIRGQLDIKSILNGAVMQHSTTALMIFSVPFTISYISKIATLEPGDIILDRHTRWRGPGPQSAGLSAKR